MKKQLLCLVAAVAFTATYAAHIAPIRTMEIPFAATAPAQDADDAETVYSAVQSMDAFNPVGSTGADADFTSTFKVCYDLNYLYFFGKCLDEYNNSAPDWAAANQWTFDNLEVFMDLDTNGSGSASAYDTNTVQIRFNRGYDSVRDCGRAAVQSYLYSHDSELPDGWVVEVAIPWKFVLATGQLTEDISMYTAAGMAHGFDVSGADSDTDGPDFRDCQTGWDNDEPQDPADRTEDNAWNNRTVFGIVTFQDVVGINDFTSSTSSVAYPNPTTGIINLDNVDATSVQIMNLAGQEVMNVNVVDNKVDISQLANGVYVMKAGKDAVRIIKN
jgi:hypothetical protein